MTGPWLVHTPKQPGPLYAIRAASEEEARIYLDAHHPPGTRLTLVPAGPEADLAGMWVTGPEIERARAAAFGRIEAAPSGRISPPEGRSEAR